ncbi:protein trichome birefringence-like 4 [Canna indica]|uniref:Protein trichome birefringence-like 4 n=1 Tax=Canna indica TaxID=4628 RepID=A0AAQ3L4K4_9LILI|nr:protein trichome birefringence-like 4 [Canna indica]
MAFSFAKHVVTFKPFFQFLLFLFPACYATMCSIFFFLVFVAFFLCKPNPPTIIIASVDSSLLAVPINANNAAHPPLPPPPPSASSPLLGDLAPMKGENNESETMTGDCDIFDGRWEYDESSPVYPPGSCPFVDSAFDCFSNGRPDLNYTKLRIDGKKMLEMLKGKRLVFVGDSLNRNMWESLVCILRHSLRDKNRVFEASGREDFRTENSYAFIFRDYNCSIEFFRSPFLVRESSIIDSDGTRRETLRLDLIEPYADGYRNADVIVFNSGHWWTHPKTSKGENFYQEGDFVFPKLSAEEAYRRALRTWAKWVQTRVDSNRTRVFFRGYSWSHFNGGQWNSGGSCDRETEPITHDRHLAKYLKLTEILESLMREMRSPAVRYLNITRMTDYRKDGHPSVYREPEAMRNQRREEIQDCSHWCLPGVPDAWNELLYAMLLSI